MSENGEKGELLSPALMSFLRRRAMEASGLLLILIGGALTAMLFSPGRLDPSWSAFSPGPVNNWFGPVGAAIAGGLRTSLGAASFFATFLPLGWGYRLLRKQAIGQRVARLFLAPVALLLLASGIYGLSGGAGSAAGGAAGVVLLGLTMPHVPPAPSVLGLGMAHYLGAGYALLGYALVLERHSLAPPVGGAFDAGPGAGTAGRRCDKAAPRRGRGWRRGIAGA